MDIANWTIERAFQVEYLVAAVLVSGYWFWRVYKRFQSQERDVPPRGGPPQGGSGRRRQKYSKADQDAIREKARRSL